MTVAELIQDRMDRRAALEAREVYEKAISRHFSEAERLAKTDPKQAERIAWGAVALRMDARYELLP